MGAEDNDLTVGARVTCVHRVTMAAPNGRHAGTLLAINDPRAWPQAFTSGTLPTQAEVDAHVARLQSQGLLRGDRRPIAWDFGAVYWEGAETILTLAWLDAEVPLRDDGPTDAADWGSEA